MDSLMREVDTALATKDYNRLSRIFTTGWQSIGQGEQRTLAAYFIHSAVVGNHFSVRQALADNANTMLPVFQTVLGHLPATVEGAADNQLRNEIFQYLTQDADDPDYTTAARILATMRMETDDPTHVYYMDPVARTNVYVQMAECFLAEDEIAESDAAVNKAGAVVEQIISSSKDDKTVVAQHLAVKVRLPVLVQRRP